LPGDDAAALAKRVAPGGSVVAIDGGQAMIDAARERQRDASGLSFDVADAAHWNGGRAGWEPLKPT
jgi:ubiquinone/menaquinone biosynthesis C-methylase UbiE